MNSKISNSLIDKLHPATKPFEVRDLHLKGFILRVQPSGSMSYYIEYARGRRMAIGRSPAITPLMAREKAKEILAQTYRGEDPMMIKRKARAHTVESFIDGEYATWAHTNIKSAKATIARLKFSFRELLNRKLGDITQWNIEQWRAKRSRVLVRRRNDSIDPNAPSTRTIKLSTINRDLDDLRAALAKAVQWKLIQSSPMDLVKRSRLDRSPSARFLTQDEETCLRRALADREERIRSNRAQGNKWRTERGYPNLASLQDRHFADRLHPMVLFSLHTGLRRGEVFSLDWDCVDLDRATLMVRGNNAKSGHTRYIPLNSEALQILRKWRTDLGEANGLVFPGNAGQQLNNVRRSWLGVLAKAGIKHFRWHDMRHSFASRLAMAGVDLNTIRELLGHSDYQMTLRYAHLAPSHKAAAVEKLTALGVSTIEKVVPLRTATSV